MSVQDDKNIETETESEQEAPVSRTRRAMLRRGVVAMPAILTLHSGSALARSSNMISAAPAGTKDGLGRTLCLDTKSVYPADEYGHAYDLGDPPHAVINILRDRDHRTVRGATGDEHKISEDEMCRQGGEFWVRRRWGWGWRSVNMPHNGMVVSAGAMTSVAEYVTDNLV